MKRIGILSCVVIILGFLGCRKDRLDEAYVGEYTWAFSAAPMSRYSSYHAYTYSTSNPEVRYTLKAKSNGNFILFLDDTRIGKFKSEEVNPKFGESKLFLEGIPEDDAAISCFYAGELDCSDRDDWLGTYKGTYKSVSQMEDPESGNFYWPSGWGKIEEREVVLSAHESSGACLLYIRIDSGGLEDAPFALDLDPTRLLPGQGDVRRNGDSLIIHRTPFGRYDAAFKYSFEGVKID